MKLATRTPPLVEETAAEPQTQSGVARTWLAAVSKATWALLALTLLGFTIFAHQMLHDLRAPDALRRAAA